MNRQRHMWKQVENNLICPITQVMMNDPVLAEDGNTYQRIAIQKWFRTKTSSPVTGLALISKNLIPNYMIKGIIQQCKQVSKYVPNSQQQYDLTIFPQNPIAPTVSEIIIGYGTQSRKSKVCYPNGDVYEGYWNGKKTGMGKLFYANGEIYQGYFSDDSCHGFGWKKYVDGSEYLGYWEIGRRSGYGEMKLLLSSQPNTDRLIPMNYWGNWKGDKKNGKGRCSFWGNDIAYYDGDWEDNERTGFGIFVDSIFHCEGDFRQGVLSGRGRVFSFVNGTYQGEYYNGLRSGQGTFIYPNGDQYCGQWRLGQKHGHGKLFVLETGQTFVGNFLNDKKHGKGQVIERNGKEYYQVFWVKGKQRKQPLVIVIDQ